MLGKLFGSKSRVKILKLFLLHPEKKYYIREISRDLKLQINSVSRELENLEKFGLLTSSSFEPEHEDGKAKKKVSSTKARKNDKKYFRVDTEFVLYEEIKALIVKAQVLYERDFIDKLMKTGRPKLLILTGFFVNIPEMPIDMLLVGRMNKVKLIKIIKDLESDLGREINYTIMDVKEFKYRRDITDVFLYGILESKKISVIDELGAC